MFCPQCGTPNDNESNFCKQCGMKLADGGPMPPAARHAGRQAPPRRGCCSCSCSGIFVGCFFLLVFLAGFAAYVLYASPEFAVKFMAPSAEVKTEIAALKSEPADAAKIDNILAASQNHFASSDKTAEIIFKESEINAYIAREIAKVSARLTEKDSVELQKAGVRDVSVSEVKFGLSPAGFKLFVTGKIMKLETFLYVAGNVSVAGDDFKFAMTDCQLGKIRMPMAFLNTLWDQLKPNFKIQKGTSVIDMGKFRLKVNAIKFADKSVAFECVKAK